MNKGFIITLSGISGAGKSHLIKSLIERCDSFEKLKAVTTRTKRKDEVEGIDKFFLSLEEFKVKDYNNQMCVVNNVFGNMYGYYKSDMDKTNEGINLVTELYYKEVESFKKEYPNTISVYILPSDISKTIEELEARNTSYEELQKRISDIKSEISFFEDPANHDFDIIITNNYDIKSVENFIDSILKTINERINGSLTSLTSILLSKVDNDLKECVDNYIKSDKNKPIIYTSFDGDDMHYLHNICKNEIERGNVPLNPETSLGYYVSTVSLGGKKIEVMKDCLTLEMLADKMSVYSKKDRPLSEGIIAEMLLWSIKKEKGVDIIEGITQLKINPKIKSCSLTELKYFLENHDAVAKYELFNNLLNDYNNSEHKSGYIIANMENYKHIDWARVYCYQNGICPISPQNILPLYLYKDNMQEYLESRLELLKRSDKVLLFINRNNLNDDLLRLDPYSLAEIYFLNQCLPNKKIEIVGWDEALVPKYNQNQKWALTTKEDLEVRKLVKKW